jgi:hypothetical protein
MPELKEVFDMVSQKSEPDLDAWKEQERRQLRTVRNRKIGGFAVTAAMALALGAVVLGTRADRNGTGAHPVVTPTERVARDFARAVGAFDAGEAMSHLAGDADIAGLVTSLGDEGLRGVPEELPRFLSMLKAMGYQQAFSRYPVCDATGTLVRCDVSIHLLGSNEFGRAAFGGSFFELTVRGNEIVRASVHWDTGRLSRAAWEPFANWVSTAYPEDAAVMYEDATYGAARLSGRSIHLWEQRVREYVDEQRMREEAEAAAVRHAPIGRVSEVAGGIRFSFSVPSGGWYRFGHISINKSIVGPQGAEAIVFWTTFPDGPIAELCADLPATAGSGAVAAAVAANPGTDLATGPTNVVIDGHPAKRVTLTVREDVGCDPGYFYTWQDIEVGPLWTETSVGDTIRVWIVDVGGSRLFIGAVSRDETDGLSREVEQIVGSTRFE